jgi:hypothetical protein
VVSGITPRLGWDNVESFLLVKKHMKYASLVSQSQKGAAMPTIPELANAFMEFSTQAQPVIDATIKLGTSAFTIGSSVVKVLQHGKQVFTVAVGKKKKKPQVKAGVTRSKKAKPIEGNEIIKKKQVAIIIEVSRPSVQDVAFYLQENKIDANLVVISKIGGPSNTGLNERKPKEWFELVQEFSQAIDAVKREIGATKTHIFISAPIALTFGLGAVWGTVDKAFVYHWDGKQYRRMMEVKRELRFAKPQKVKQK